MTESDVHLWTPERWARFERARRTRRSIMRWRWVVVALTGLLAAALLLRGNVVIGGLLAALVGARVVMMTRLTRLTRKRRECGPRPSQLAG
jgi:hypothetical protein